MGEMYRAVMRTRSVVRMNDLSLGRGRTMGRKGTGDFTVPYDVIIVVSMMLRVRQCMISHTSGGGCESLSSAMQYRGQNMSGGR